MRMKFADSLIDKLIQDRLYPNPGQEQPKKTKSSSFSFSVLPDLLTEYEQIDASNNQWYLPKSKQDCMACWLVQVREIVH